MELCHAGVGFGSYSHVAMLIDIGDVDQLLLSCSVASEKNYRVIVFSV